jgi:hypothetical protein
MHFNMVVDTRTKVSHIDYISVVIFWNPSQPNQDWAILSILWTILVAFSKCWVQIENVDKLVFVTIIGHVIFMLIVWNIQTWWLYCMNHNPI